MYKGYIAAVVTPFCNGRLDLDSFGSYIDYLSGSPLSGFVVCGSTGESLSLSDDEKIELVKKASTVNSGRKKIIAGVIDASTSRCIDFIKKVENYVDAFLCICPFYVKPSQDQIVAHFKRLSGSTGNDIILYNNPGRVGTSIGFEAFRRLTGISNIKAVKECTSDLSVFSLWRPQVKRDFDFLTGNDDTACGAFAMGAEGCISVTANIVPHLCAEMFDAFCNRNNEKFNELRDKSAPLHKLMFAEPSPGPVKYVLSKMGLMKNELRQPLAPISADLCRKIDKILEGLRANG